MLKIVELHPGDTPGKEYVVLQNLGISTVSLKGWALTGDAWLSGNAGKSAQETYIFTDDVPIKPYTRVVLFTGGGVDGWTPTTDGKQALLIYWNRGEAIWSRCSYVHLLQVAASRKVVKFEETDYSLPAADRTADRPVAY